jgi:hypothetical protein
MAMGSVRDIVEKLVYLDKCLRQLQKMMIDLVHRLDVVEENSISHENRLQELEEDNDE